MLTKISAMTLLYVPGDKYRVNLFNVKQLRSLFIPAKPITDPQAIRVLDPLQIIDKDHAVLKVMTVEGGRTLVWNENIRSERELNERVSLLINKYSSLYRDNQYHWQVHSYPDGENFWNNVLKVKEKFDSGDLQSLWKKSQYYLFRSKVYEAKILEEVPEINSGNTISLVMELELTYLREWLEDSILRTDSKTVGVQLGVFAPSKDGIPEGVALKDEHISWVSILNPEAVLIPQ
jgi:hypothetical protein